MQLLNAEVNVPVRFDHMRQNVPCVVTVDTSGDVIFRVVSQSVSTRLLSLIQANRLDIIGINVGERDGSGL